jgi:hypothetical protein
MGQGWLNGGCRLVRVCFQPHPRKSGFLTNSRLLELWDERQEWRRKSSIGGSKSARNKALRKLKGGSTTLSTKLQPNVNSSSSSSSSSSLVHPTDVCAPQTTKFIRPTIDEVRDYCRERGNNVDPEKFHGYYESNGWKVGRNPMKDWKASVRTWERNDDGGTNGNRSGGKSGGQQGGGTLLSREQQREAEQLDILDRWARGDSVPET